MHVYLSNMYSQNSTFMQLRYYCAHTIILTTCSKESDTPILLDETVQAQRLAERQKLFKEYRSSRQAVLDLRNEDRQHRNEAKSKQIELAEKWQVRIELITVNYITCSLAL